MAATIVSPADAATGTPNPLQVEGTATGADFVQVRLERSDGDVYDGANWVDDATAYVPEIVAGKTVSAVVDLRPFDRIQGADAKFTVEWFGTLRNHTSGTAYYASVNDDVSSTGIFRLSANSGNQNQGIQLMDDNDSVFDSFSNDITMTDDQRIGLRWVIDAAHPTDNISYYQSTDDGVTWSEVGTPDTLTLTGDIGDVTTKLSAMPITIAASSPTGTVLSENECERFTWTDWNGTTIVDLDFTRDADAGHADADPIIDAQGIVWTKTGGSVDRVRADHLFTAFGTTDWTWATPTLDPIAHTIAARTVSAGTPSAWTANTFTPSQIVATQGDLFVRRGTGRYLWVTQLADPNNPTYSEIAAATDITCDVSDFSGVSRNHELQPVPSLVSPNIRSHVGAVAHQTPSLAMYDRTSDSSAFRTLFTAGTTGYLILVPHGTTLAGDRVTVIPAVSGGNSDVWTVANEPARYVVTLGLTGRIRESFVTL